MFIAFEGIDNIGKTTQLDLLAKSLQNSGCNVMIYRDLTVFNKSEFSKMTNENQIHFITKQRAAYTCVLQEFSANGGVVLLDRFIDSTLVYQGDTAATADLILKNHKTIVGIKPDLCFTFACLNDFDLDITRKTYDVLDRKYEENRESYNQKFIQSSYSKIRLLINASLTIDTIKELISVSVRRNSTFTNIYKLRRRKNRALSLKI